jgi:hypothetical protein
MESFSMDTLPKMMEELHDSDEGKGDNLSQYSLPAEF